MIVGADQRGIVAFYQSIVRARNRPGLRDEILGLETRDLVFDRRLVVGIRERDVAPDGRAIGRPAVGRLRLPVRPAERPLPRSAVERWAEARGATDPLVGLRYDAILILTEVVGIDVGDLIDGNVEGRQPFDRLACGRAAKAVGDEVEAAALGQALGRFDEPQPDEGGKEAVPRGLRPARPALVRLRRPIPKQHHLRRSCGRHDRLRAVEPPAAVIGSQNRAHRAVANHIVVDEPGAARTHGRGTIVHSLGQRHQRIAAP